MPGIAQGDLLNEHTADEPVATLAPRIPRARPAVIRLGRSWPAAAWRWVRCAWLRLLIWETESYLRQCNADGIVDSLSMREFRGQLAELRIRLMILEQQS